MIELLVVIAIIAILASLLLPDLAKAKAKANMTSCATNMKNWGYATLMYEGDFKDRFPVFGENSQDYTKLFWFELLAPYVARPPKGMTRQRLMEHNIVVEDFGGEVLAIDVSATKRTNLDKLLEAVALQAELLEPKADPARRARGAVLEAELDRGRGPVATVLVQDGSFAAAT